MLLRQLGHTVSGYSDTSEVGSLYEIANLKEVLEFETFSDIRNLKSLNSFIQKSEPDVIIHFAAQSLVRNSYRQPLETFEVNVNGTNNVIKAIHKLEFIKSCLIVTTDKVYKSQGSNYSYKESDPLGGAEPYGSSKSIADEISQYWLKTGLENRLTIVRAGNVIGGGDVSSERLMPELVSKYQAGQVPTLRYPNAVRPWQHVLDCLNGYLMCIEKAISENVGDIWNVGPTFQDHVSVKTVQEITATLFGIDSHEVNLSNPSFSESDYLALDSTKIRQQLGWQSKFNLVESLTETINWYQAFQRGEDMFLYTKNSIQNFISK